MLVGLAIRCLFQKQPLHVLLVLAGLCLVQELILHVHAGLSILCLLKKSLSTLALKTLYLVKNLLKNRVIREEK